MFKEYFIYQYLLMTYKKMKRNIVYTLGMEIIGKSFSALIVRCKSFVSKVIGQTTINHIYAEYVVE